MGTQHTRQLIDRYRRTGWAWGSTDGGVWLTIAGSAIREAELSERPTGARPPAPIIGSTQVLARVRREGTWFRILELAPERQQHQLVLGRFPDLTAVGWCTCSTWRYDPQARASAFVDGWREEVPDLPYRLRERYEAEHRAPLLASASGDAA